jgi:hypothetical protein
MNSNLNMVAESDDLPTQTPSATGPEEPSREDHTSPRRQRPTLPIPTTSLKTFSGGDIADWLEDVQDVAFNACHLTEAEWLERLPMYLDGEAKKIYRTTLRGRSWSAIAESLTQVFNSPMRQHRAQAELDAARQGPTESVSEFISRVQSLAHVVHRAMPEFVIRSVIKGGLRDARLTTEFLCGAATPLPILVEQLAIRERAFAETSVELHKPSEEILALQSQKFCRHCRRTGHTLTECRARKFCNSCHKSGHTSDECWASGRRKAPARRYDDQDRNI